MKNRYRKRTGRLAAQVFSLEQDVKQSLRANGMTEHVQTLQARLKVLKAQLEVRLRNCEIMEVV